MRVYWDGSANTGGSDSVKYQNHKPRCQRSAKENLGLCYNNATANKAILGYACSQDEECAHLGTGYGCGKEALDALGIGRDRFGDTADKNNPKANACLEGYFSFSNTYTCSAAQLALMTTCPAKNGNEIQSCKEEINGRLACRYRPAVQVMDNWEWCNADHGNEGQIIDVKTNTVGGAGGYYGSVNDCFDNSPKINNKEYYDGFIYVIP